MPMDFFRSPRTEGTSQTHAAPNAVFFEPVLNLEYDVRISFTHRSGLQSVRRQRVVFTTFSFRDGSLCP